MFPSLSLYQSACVVLWKEVAESCNTDVESGGVAAHNARETVSKGLKQEIIYC